jgi:hypothetical protein
MNELLAKYKAFWKEVGPIVAEKGITGFRIAFSGVGDCGCIDELDFITGGKRRRLTARQAAIEEDIDVDEFGNKMRPHPWLHDSETFTDLEESKLVLPNVAQKREVMDPELGWKIEDFVGDMPLAEVVKKVGYAVINTWFPGWEINEGSNGVVHFYPKYIEFEFTEYYEKGNKQGHKCYSETVKFPEFEGWDYDDGYRGFHVDMLLDDEASEDDEDEDE